MTDFRVGLRIEGDSSSGVRALNDTDQAADRAGRSTREMGQNARRAGTDTQRLGQSANRASRDTDRLRRSEDQASAAARALAAANARAAASARGVGGANRVAAGSLSNLTAQFNDIGVMMASGQNPLTLALQQGTQISQVIGPMGAAGAVRSLGSAFMGMINPISLVTIGTIAGVAAFSNWARSAGDAGETSMTFEEHLQAVSDATERYTGFAELAVSSTSDLEERFGSASGAVRSTLQLLERLAASEAQGAIDGIASSLSDMLGVAGDGDRRIAAADFFDVNIGLAFTDVQRAAREEARLLTSEFVNQRSELAGSTGDLDAQIDVLSELIATTERLADANGNRSTQEEAMLQQMAEALLVMFEQRGAVEDAASAAKVAYQQYYDSRIKAEEFLANMRGRELDEQAAIYGQLAQTPPLFDQISVGTSEGGGADTVEVLLRPGTGSAAFVTSFELDHRLEGTLPWTTIAITTGDGGALITAYDLSDDIELRAKSFADATPGGYSPIIDFDLSSNLVTAPPSVPAAAVTVTDQVESALIEIASGPGTAIAGFQVYRVPLTVVVDRSVHAVSPPLASLPSTTVSYTDNVVAGTYDYWVEAFDSDGNAGELSGPSQVVVTAAPP